MVFAKEHGILETQTWRIAGSDEKLYILYRTSLVIKFRSKDIHSANVYSITSASFIRLLTAVMTVLVVASIGTAGTVVFSSTNLPIVVINTGGKTIPNEPKITADMKIIFNGPGKRNNIGDTVYNYNGKIGIEIRGSSSQMFNKKQYAVETRDSLGNDINVSLLGLPAEADWVLFAAYNDKTLMRDALIYTLSRAIGRYASRVVYCEMVLNGEYRGVYILFEKIKRGANRVPISKLEANDITGDAVTGGYIFKIDKTTAGDRWWVSPFPPKDIVQKIQYVYDYPEPDKMVDTQKTYIQHFMTSFETLMNSAGHADTVNGYTKMLDVGSAVDFFLLQELGKNADAYRFSAFLYKDKDSKGGKLNIGPLWDFTLAFGNANYFSAEIPTGWELSYLNSADYFNEYEVPFWWDKLFQDAVFMQTVKTRWVSLRTAQFSQGSIFKYIDSIAVLIDEAQQRNFTTWPILNSYVWPNPYVGGNYTNEISYLKNWILTRIRWMDLALAGYTLGVARTDDELIKSPLILSQNYPNPFNPSTVIPYRLAVNSKIRLKVYDMLGRDVVTLADRFERAGDHSVSFDGSNLPSGVYFYRLQAETHSETKKLTLTK